MCKTSEKPVGKLLMCSGLLHDKWMTKKSFTHTLWFLRRFSTKFYARLCTILSTLSYLFEQLLYPISTALIIRIINNIKEFKGACA